ncbi:MAG: (d)CMP kinase [Chitinophagales bacterium]|nr:(d)CMP kinase [Chitinophagales bacterium]
MLQPFVIAIDGFSSSGKSTLAKQLAEKLNLKFVDSGAYYRAVTLYFIEHNISFQNPDLLIEALQAIDVLFEYDAIQKQSKTFLNGINVENKIRDMQVSELVSEVSALSPVRKFVSNTLRNINDQKGLIMDGRDIGTVVFPDAQLKIFLTANEKTRSERRFLEMKNKGAEVTEYEILQNLSGRDLLDSTRKTAPLKQAGDAVVIDNSNLSLQQQLEIATKFAETALQKYLRK